MLKFPGRVEGFAAEPWGFVAVKSVTGGVRGLAGFPSDLSCLHMANT